MANNNLNGSHVLNALLAIHEHNKHIDKDVSQLYNAVKKQNQRRSFKKLQPKHFQHLYQYCYQLDNQIKNKQYVGLFATLCSLPCQQRTTYLAAFKQDLKQDLNDNILNQLCFSCIQYQKTPNLLQVWRIIKQHSNLTNHTLLRWEKSLISLANTNQPTQLLQFIGPAH